MSLGQTHLEAIAAKHGVDLNDCQPASRSERLAQLKQLLADRQVPHPIPTDVADHYYNLAASGQPFGVGSLSEENVDLGEYANFQHYEQYSL
ncbi:MAG: hypothetical protein ACK53V_10515, partial [Planctomycetota bacterium]